MRTISKLALAVLFGSIILAGCSATTGSGGYGYSSYNQPNHGYSSYGNGYGNRGHGNNY